MNAKQARITNKILSTVAFDPPDFRSEVGRTTHYATRYMFEKENKEKI